MHRMRPSTCSMPRSLSDFHFLTPETSLLILDDDHCGKVTLFEATRGFQESYPHVKDIDVKGGDITGPTADIVID